MSHNTVCGTVESCFYSRSSTWHGTRRTWWCPIISSTVLSGPWATEEPSRSSADASWMTSVSRHPRSSHVGDSVPPQLILQLSFSPLSKWDMVPGLNTFRNFGSIVWTPMCSSWNMKTCTRWEPNKALTSVKIIRLQPAGVLNLFWHLNNIAGLLCWHKYVYWWDFFMHCLVYAALITTITMLVQYYSVWWLLSSAGVV